ncbi:hypothetical protein S83_021935, partial [Arachis hypogaea]
HWSLSQSPSPESRRSSCGLPRRLTRVSSLSSSLLEEEASRGGRRLLRRLPWSCRPSPSSGFGFSPSPWAVDSWFERVKKEQNNHQIVLLSTYSSSH